MTFGKNVRNNMVYEKYVQLQKYPSIKIAGHNNGQVQNTLTDKEKYSITF